mgnify:CR=1 FL=1
MYNQISTMNIFFMPQPVLNKSKGLAHGSSKARAMKMLSFTALLRIESVPYVSVERRTFPL